MSAPTIERWTTLSAAAVGTAAAALVLAAFLPLALGGPAIEKLTTLFVYVILAVTWNALAGYAGLVSIGQQAFFGLGAYAAVRLSAAGVPVYPALPLAALAVGAASVAISAPMLRLKAGEFAIGMWVVAEIAHLLVNLDPLVQGETGTSLVALNAYAPEERRTAIYWLALGSTTLILGSLFVLLRSRQGAAVQAIRDDEEAAASIGVGVQATKRLIFVLAGFGAALAGALQLASATSFQPHTFFSVQWTAYMIFMALVGGLGTFEGPIAGAVVFFAIEAQFGDTGVWYLVGLGAAALAFSLLLPHGLWGFVQRRSGLRLLFVGYRVRLSPLVGKEL